MDIRSLPARLCIGALVLGAAAVGLAVTQSPADSAQPPAPAPAAAPAAAPAHLRHRRAGELAPARQARLDQLAAALGLSGIQKGQIKELMILQHRKHGHQDRADRHPAQAERQDRHHRDHRGGAALSRREFRHELKAVLTPDQFAKLKALRAARHAAAPAAASSALPANS